LSYNFNNFYGFVTLASTRLKLPEYDADVGVLTKCYCYIYMCVCVCVCVCFAFVGIDNKLYKMHGTYIKIT